MGQITFPLHPEHGFSWHAPPRPTVTSVELRLESVEPIIDLVASRWNQQLARPPAVAVHCVGLRGQPPRVVSVPISPPAVRVRSFEFAASSEGSSDMPGGSAPGPCPHQGRRDGRCTAVSSPPPRGHLDEHALLAAGSTRIKPPSDVIKLGDRLHYLLQPSLESLLAERSLAFPSQPFPFQLEGIAFLYPRHAAILADEMGLGKTMQAITGIRLLLRCAEIRRALVVCPKALVTNWQREFRLWAPEVPLLVIEGNEIKRLWQWQLPGMPVRIVNYELLCRDRQLFEGSFGQQPSRPHFDLVVLDEAQRIKNRSGATSQVVRAIARKRNWALTGTPVENSTEDLVGIFEFLAPGLLSPNWKPRRMGRAVSDSVLRRTKEQVLDDLPPKLLRDAELDLSPQQRESYRLAEDQGVLRLSQLGASATIQHVFELVLRLKQICNFDPATGASSKFEQLEADLEEIARSGRKAIVFSQWVGTLQQLARRLGHFGPLEYHGRIRSSQRDGVIRRFREDRRSHLMLMSYGAGGVGLNLQFANYLFLFDRWWNPAVEDQATARAHRIGMSGPLTVTRFLVRNTIEERIDQILRQKRELFQLVFSIDQTPRNVGLTQEQLFGLFQLRCPGDSAERAA